MMARSWKAWVLVPLTTVLLTGCRIEPNMVRPEVIAARWEAGRPESRTWSIALYDSLDRLGAGLLTTPPAAIAAFCPAYPRQTRTERKTFWVSLFSALSHFESGHDPTRRYRENFRDSTGKFVVSRGLLQISLESGNAYGCGFATAQAIHEPLPNLRCGVRILNRWIGRDRVIAAKRQGRWRGAARYWSPFRRASARRQIAAWTSALPMCRN